MAGFFAKLIRRVTHTDQVRHLDAATGGRRGHGWSRFGPVNAEINAARERVQVRAIGTVRNSGWATNAVDNFVSYGLVSDGIIPGSRHPDFAIRAELQRRFARWAMRCGVDGTTGFYAMQAIAARHMIEAGECYWQMVTDADGELRLQLIPAERCDASMSREMAGGGRIVAGIEFRADGRISAYHFLPDTDPFGSFGPSVRVDGADVCHWFKPLSPGQVHGISWLHSVLLPLHDQDQTEDAISIGQKISAMHCGFLTDLNGAGGQLFDGVQTGSVMESGLEPGTLKVLPAGVDVKFSTPREASESVAFLKYGLRKIAAGVGLPTHLVDNDLSDANYSSLRAGSLAFAKRCSAIQQHVIIPQLTAYGKGG